MFTVHQSRKRYPSDLTDEQWTLVEPLLPSNSRPVGCFILSRHVQPSTLRSEGTYRVRLGAAYQQALDMATFLCRVPCRRLKTPSS